MKCCRYCFASLLVLSGGFAAGSSSPPAQKADNSGSDEWMFSLLPKAFQRNPVFNMTVVTEMTESGRKMRPVSPEQPMYYVAHAGGFRQLGETLGGEKSPTAADLERTLKQSLAANGYLPVAEEGQRPALVLIYTWGSHNVMFDNDWHMQRMFPELVRRNILERSLLIGGKNFTTNLGRSMEFGQSLLDATGKQEYLINQAANDCYFVIASAYDYAALARGERKLLWRTKMTVNSQGVSMTESLPRLIATAAPFLGRETGEAETISKRFPRTGHVEIGTPTVVEEDSAPPAARVPAKDSQR